MKKQHHPWCTSGEAAANCSQCKILRRDYPFRPGETSDDATARYFEDLCKPAVVGSGRQLTAGPESRRELVSRATEEQANQDRIREEQARWRAQSAKAKRESPSATRRVRHKAGEIHRIEAAKKPPHRRKPYNPTQLGQPTQARNAKTLSGFHEENLAPADAPPVIRAKEKSPLSPVEAGKRQTYLDKALNDHEVQQLFRFVIGTMIADGQMRLAKKDNRQPVFVQKDGHNRIPFSDSERLEIGARNYVWSKLPEESRRDLDIIVTQVMPRGEKFVDPIAFGKTISRSNDHRVAKGAYIGTVRKLAHHIGHLYVEWELGQFRRKQDIENMKKIR